MIGASIYTIGYSSRNVDDFLGLLHDIQVSFLIDVRSTPYSRHQPAFSMPALASRVRHENIRYVFMGNQLGGKPKDRDCYVNGRVAYSRVMGKPNYQEGIKRLHNACMKNLHVALMCSELKPQDCHRSKLIGETLASKGIDVKHIDENGRLKDHKQVVDALIGDQPFLFDRGEISFVSRRRY